MKVKVKVLVTQSYLNFCDPMECIAHQAPQSMEFSRKEYWSAFPSSGDLPNPGSPTLQADLYHLSH